MVVRALIAIVLGLIAFYVAALFLDHILSVLIGLAAGLVIFFGYDRPFA